MPGRWDKEENDLDDNKTHKTLDPKSYEDIVNKLGYNIYLDPKPEYINSNESRIGFKYHPTDHKKGIRLTKAMENFAIALNDVHNELYLYDGNNINKFEDERIIQLSKKIDKGLLRIKTGNTEHDLWMKELSKLKDLMLFWIKEDIMLRVIVFDELGIELTPSEKEHINKWNL